MELHLPFRQCTVTIRLLLKWIDFVFYNFHFISYFCYTGELESTTSETSHITGHRSFVKPTGLDIFALTKGSKVKCSNDRQIKQKTENQIKDQVKDSGIDTGLSSSCNTLIDEVLKSKVKIVYFSK